MKSSRVILSSAAICFSAAACLGALPHYVGYQLQARTNFAFNPGGSYNVPGTYFFSGEDIRVNNSRQVSFHLSVTTGDFQSVWFGQNGAGGIVYNSANDAFLGQTSLNNAGKVVWEQTFLPPNGLYFYDHTSMTSGFLTSRPLGATGWSSPRINDSGQVGYRAIFSGSGNTWVSWEAPTTTAFHAVEAGVDPGSPYSFLFTPNFNNNRQIAGKVRLGLAGQTGESQPDEVRLFNADGTSTLIAQDHDGNASSPYARFDNSVGVNNVGQVAFVANLQAGGRGVFLSNGTTTLTIATTTAPGTPVSNIETFAAAVNDSGVVVFRAMDTAGRRAIWVGDGTSLAKVVTHLDILPSDLGPARVEQNDTSPVFGGAPAINAGGDVAFNASLTPPGDNQVEWGTGVYLALVPQKGDMNCDGAVNPADVPAFVTALLDPNEYMLTYPACDISLGDFDGGGVNGADAQPFSAAVLGL